MTLASILVKTHIPPYIKKNIVKQSLFSFFKLIILQLNQVI